MMLKFSRSLVHRNQLVRKLLHERTGDVKNAPWLGSFTSQHEFSTAGSGLVNNENISGRTFADFSVFKGKAALSVSPIPPKFSRIGTGSKVDRKGVVLLTFMPAIGLRKYDYEKRQMFALNITEVGCLISLGASESCEFFHDPSMKSSLEGQVKKTLSVSPIQDGGGYFFNMSILNSVQKTTERFYVPVTKAEFAVMRTALGFVLPHIMGWDRVVAPQLAETSAPNQPKQPVQEQMRLDPEFEWGR